MSAPPTAEERFQVLLDRNAKQVASGPFTSPRPMRFIKEFVTQTGFQSLYILTCADGCVHPEEIFGLKKGEANVIRNAGGRAIESDVFRTLGVMSSIAPIGLLVVLHHTDCGGLSTTDEEVAEILAKRNPERAGEVQGYTFGTFKDIGLDQSIRDDVERIKAWPFLNKDAKIVGYAYETETGELRHVC